LKREAYNWKPRGRDLNNKKKYRKRRKRNNTCCRGGTGGGAGKKPLGKTQEKLSMLNERRKKRLVKIKRGRVRNRRN